MVIGFKKQFEAPIAAGTKIHTVREDKKLRWNPGVKMHMYSGGRFSKEYHQFNEKTCTSTQRVFMTYDYELEITVGVNELFGIEERQQFAKNDGFESWEAFEDWWIPVLKSRPNQEYSGIVIHWTSFRY